MVLADQLININVHVVISCCVGHWCFFLINSTSLAEILSDLTMHIKSERFGITVRRAHVLEDALKSVFLDPTMSID